MKNYCLWVHYCDMEENLSKWQSLVKQQDPGLVLIGDAPGIYHCISSVLYWFLLLSQCTVCKSSGSPSCWAWISLWPLAVISPSSPRVFPIPDLPVIWHQADQRLGAAGGITVQRPRLSQWETRIRREPDGNCSFFHLPGRLFWEVPYCFSELLAECLIKAPCNGFLIFAWYLYFAIPTFEY